METDYQTKHNPGAFKRRQNTRLVYYAKRMVNTLGHGDFRGGVNYLVSEGLNIWNDRLPALAIGKSLECNLCGYQGRFAHKSNRLGIAWNSVCPRCDSRSRHRGLFLLYQQEIGKDASVLHFAPEPVLSQLFNQNKSYKTTDYLLEDVDFPKQDIQALSLESNVYDWVLCNHVLEHVADDVAGMKNLSRILKAGGHAIITIPGDFEREKSIIFKDLSLNGHYRDYGLDVIDKLNMAFSAVNTIDLSVNVPAMFGIRKGELAFLCAK